MRARISSQTLQDTAAREWARTQNPALAPGFLFPEFLRSRSQGGPTGEPGRPQPAVGRSRRTLAARTGLIPRIAPWPGARAGRRDRCSWVSALEGSSAGRPGRRPPNSGMHLDPILYVKNGLSVYATRLRPRREATPRSRRETLPHPPSIALGTYSLAGAAGVLRCARCLRNPLTCGLLFLRGYRR